MGKKGSGNIKINLHAYFVIMKGELNHVVTRLLIITFSAHYNKELLKSITGTKTKTKTKTNASTTFYFKNNFTSRFCDEPGNEIDRIII